MITDATGTLRLAALKQPKTDDDGFRLLIVRWRNPKIKRAIYDWWDSRLSPSHGLLSEAFTRDVSLDETWQWYAERFLNEMANRGARIALDEVCEMIKGGRTVTLLCYCENDARCHRGLVAQLLRDRLGNF